MDSNPAQPLQTFGGSFLNSLMRRLKRLVALSFPGCRHVRTGPVRHFSLCSGALSVTVIPIEHGNILEGYRHSETNIAVTLRSGSGRFLIEAWYHGAWCSDMPLGRIVLSAEAVNSTKYFSFNRPVGYLHVSPADSPQSNSEDNRLGDRETVFI